MLIHFPWKASQYCYQDISYLNHYLANISEEPVNFFFFFNLLHQVSHNQVRYVFLLCHAPDQCSNTETVLHIFYVTLIGQGGLGLLVIYCLCRVTIIREYCFYFLLLHTQR